MAALVPLVTVILADPSTSPASSRRMVLGLALGSDRSGAPPLPQLLAPIGLLLPVGDRDHRAALAMALPAAAATWLVARRACSRPFGSGVAATVVALAFSATAGLLLSATDPAAALVLVAIEASLAAIATAGRSKARASISIAVTAVALALWAAPRLSVAALVALVGATRGREAGWPRRAVLACLPIVVCLAATIWVRDTTAWLTLGHPLRDGLFSTVAPARLGTAAAERVAWVLAAGALGATLLGGRLRDQPRDERFALAAAGIAAAMASLVGAEGGLAVAVGCLVPGATSAVSALHIAVRRGLGARERAWQRVAAWLVPVLSLGLSARALEEELAARRRDRSALAALDAAALLTTGLAPPRAVLITEDLRTVLAWAHARASDGLRPDVRILPAQSLLVGGPSRMASRTIEEVPQAAEVLRGLLARGVLDEPDVSPLAQRATLLADLPAARLRPIARHADPNGLAVRLALERVDPSDRRVLRTALERRLRFLAEGLASVPMDEPLRQALRASATREARLLSLASDRDGALSALSRSLSLGADPRRVTRWVARVHAKQSLESEPLCGDE